MSSIPLYPDACELTLDLRSYLHERLRTLPERVSEYTFANLYLFREKHHYRLSMLTNNIAAIIGKDGNAPFFMLPFGLPDEQHPLATLQRSSHPEMRNREPENSTGTFGVHGCGGPR